MRKDIPLQGSRNKKVNAVKEMRKSKAKNAYAKDVASKMGASTPKKRESINYKTPSRRTQKARAKRRY